MGRTQIAGTIVIDDDSIQIHRLNTIPAGFAGRVGLRLNIPFGYVTWRMLPHMLWDCVPKLRTHHKESQGGSRTDCCCRLAGIVYNAASALLSTGGAFSPLVKPV